MDRLPLSADESVRSFLRRGSSVAKKVLILCALAAAFVLPGSASASFIVARDATGIQLGVDAKGVAMVSFTEAGVQKHVMARGAVDAVAPKPGVEAGRVRHRLGRRLGLAE